MDEEIALVVVPWIEVIRQIIEEKDVTSSCMHNTDHTGLFNAKLQNSVYVKNQ